MNKQKILTIIQIIALVLAVVGAVSLFVNSIQLLVYTTGREFFKEFQKSYAIISLFASVFAFAGVAAGTASLFAKKNGAQKACIAISVITVAAFIILLIASECLYLKNGISTDYEGLPHVVYTLRYATYSGVLSLLIQQLTFSALFTAPLIANYVIDLKSAKAQQIQPAEISAQTEKENN